MKREKEKYKPEFKNQIKISVDQKRRAKQSQAAGEDSLGLCQKYMADNLKSLPLDKVEQLKHQKEKHL